MLRLKMVLLPTSCAKNHNKSVTNQIIKGNTQVGGLWVEREGGVTTHLGSLGFVVGD